MIEKFARFQRWIPLVLIGFFALFSLVYVGLFYKPTVAMTVNDGKVLHVNNRSEAEVEVYSALPFKATYQLTTGEKFAMDLRLLGFSYFSQEELNRLDTISGKSLWEKFRPFFDVTRSQMITVFPERMFWLAPLEETIKPYPQLLKQEPETNHIVLDPTGAPVITDRLNGYSIDPAAFVAATKTVEQTKSFNDITLESTPIEAEDQSGLLAQYPNILDYVTIDIPDDYVLKQNLTTAFYRMQNIYIPAGQTMVISDLMGPLEEGNGFLTRPNRDGKEITGAGVDLMIDGLQKLAYNKMSVLSYKGAMFNIGEPGDAFTQLTVQNTTPADVVFSLSIKGNSLSIVLASK